MAVMGEIVEAHVSVPKSWLKGLEEGFGVKIEELSERQLTSIFSFALGYVDYSDRGIVMELREQAGITGEMPEDF